METINVATKRLSNFKKRAKKLARKAERLDREFDFNIRKEDQFTKAVKIRNGGLDCEEVPVSYTPVDVSGSEQVKIEGWEMLAAVDFTEGGNVVRSHVDDLDEEWQNTDSTRCDHCGHKRQRNTCYIIRSEEGEEKQVGSSCFKDYTGHPSAEQLANLYSRVHKMLTNPTFRTPRIEEQEKTKERNFIELRSFLEIVDRVIQKHGWVSGSDAYRNHRKRSTKSRALSLYRRQGEESKRLFEDYEETEHDIDKVLEWARSLDADGNYENNLQTLANCTMFDADKHAGFAASIFAAYDRHMARKEQNEKDAESEFQGSEGDRLEDLTLTLEMHKSLGKCQYSGDIKSLYKFRDEENNVYCWFTTSNPCFQEDTEHAGHFLSNLEGETFEGMRATVKDHNTFNRTEQTIVNRVWFPHNTATA